MDSFLQAAGVLYFVASALCILSLALPDWVVSDEHGRDLRLGLLMQCQRIYGREMECQYTENGPMEWIVAAFLIICGIGTLCMGIVMIVLSSKFPRWEEISKVYGSYGVDNVLPRNYDVPRRIWFAADRRTFVFASK